MNLFDDTGPRARKELLAEIHNRSAVLPALLYKLRADRTSKLTR